MRSERGPGVNHFFEKGEQRQGSLPTASERFWDCNLPGAARQDVKVYQRRSGVPDVLPGRIPKQDVLLPNAQTFGRWRQALHPEDIT
eukprot:scaffold367_cov254-Pinguiococcus_pyrenoidosus.AAC.20